MVRETAAISATLCATVPALMPLAERGMAATHDGFLHVQRLIAIEAAILGGAPFTRWLPDLAYGYGQPLLLYYAPLSYVPALLARVFWVGYVTSFEVASGLALVFSALAMYVLARSLFGPVAACVAASVYALLPYQLVDLYVRGALAESWAFVWLPLATWCAIGAWTDGRPRWSVGLALSVAGLVLTHNVTALLFLPALLALAILLHLSRPANSPVSPFRPLLAIALGLALSAWFWLPALAERHLVHLEQTIEPELFASFFVRGWPPFRPEPLYDYQLPVSTALGYPIFWPQLGLVQGVVMLCGVVAAVRTSGVRRIVAIWAVLLAVGGYLMQLGPLAAVYDWVPLLQFVQFPWRMLTLVGLGSAILAGVLVDVVSARAAIRVAFAVVIVAASLVTALAGLDPEITPVDERTLSVESITRAELADYGLGTTHSGEYLPVSSGQRNSSRFRKTMLDAGAGQDGDQAAQAPSALHVERVDWRADRIQVDLNATAPDRLVLHQFLFPGWTARLDGEPVELASVGQLGLIGVEVPAGRHRIDVAWDWTPPRLAAAFVSLVSLLLLVALGAGPGWRPTPRHVLIGAATVGFLASLLAPPWIPQAVTEPSQSSISPARDVGGLTLIDAHLDRSRLPSRGSFLPELAPERSITASMTWLVREPPRVGYRAFLEIVAEDGQVVHRAPWIYEPLSGLWERGEIVQTTITARPPAARLADTFQVRLVFDRPERIAPLVLTTVDGPTTEVIADDWPSEEAVTIGSDIRLAATTATDGGVHRELRVEPGGSLGVSVRWEHVGMTPNVERELLAVAVLQGPRGEIVSDPRRPGDWFAPLPFWQRGDIVEQQIRLNLPAWVPSGSYPLVVRVYARDLARGGASEPGASEARPRGRPIAELQLGDVLVEP